MRTEIYDPTENHAAPAGAHLVYGGGPLLTNVKVFTVFWGDVWNTTQKADMDYLNGFYDFILSSSLMDELAEYNTQSYKVGHGTHIGTVVVSDGSQPPPPVPGPPPPPPPPPTGCLTGFIPGALRPKAEPLNTKLSSTVDDSDIRNMIGSKIADGTLPKPDINTLFVVYTPSGITVTQGGQGSCSVFCGYHDSTPDFYYAVLPYPDCAGCLGGLSVQEALTVTSSHELCEAITDPAVGNGWYDQANGEIGDICAWNFKKVGEYTVQQEWSNKLNSCV